MPRHASLHPYRLPLRTPLRLAFGTFAAREGVLLRLEDDAGHVGWGDCAPLPGFSPDTLPAAHASLGTWVGSGDDRVLTLAARAAVEGARLEIEAAARGTTLSYLLAPSPASDVALSALLTGDDAEVIGRARAARAAGYRSAKLKVGAQEVGADAARVRNVLDVLGNGLELRLDANRAWTYDEACRFADAVAGLNLAYVEEPLRTPDRLHDLARNTGLPLALDESLLELNPADLAHHCYARAIILKPTVLGGLRAATEWAAHAGQAGLSAVVSGAFESGIGTRQACALAAALGPQAAGLDPYNRLAADVLAPRLSLDGPHVALADVLAPRMVVLP